MIKNIIMGSFIVLLLGFIVSCGKTNEKKFSAIEDLNNPNVKIGGEIGTLSLRIGEDKIPNAKFVSFKSCSDTYPALAAGKIDAIVFDKPALDYAAKEQEAFMILDLELAKGNISVGGPLRNKELMGKVNEFIRKYRTDGTYNEMYDRWVKSENPEMPAIPEPENPTGTIIVGTECLNAPMNFIGQNNELTGFDIEFIKRLALYLNMKCEIKVMDYDALFPACEAGKIDLAVANMDSTPERQETILFSDEYINSPIAVMIRKENYKSTP